MILLIPAKIDPERDAVAAAWERGGGTVVRLDRFWEPPTLDPGQVRLYGNDTFCHILAQKLGLELISPPDDLLLHVPPRFLHRQVKRATLEDALTFPKFVKPLVPKLFGARVYADADQLAQECRGLPPDTPILVSQVVSIHAEARAFVLRGQVQTWAIYEGEGEGAEDFLSEMAASSLLPITCVVDAALLDDGWALLEANASWGSGLNGCDPKAVIDCLKWATRA